MIDKQEEWIHCDMWQMEKSDKEVRQNHNGGLQLSADGRQPSCCSRTKMGEMPIKAVIFEICTT